MKEFFIESLDDSFKALGAIPCSQEERLAIRAKAVGLSGNAGVVSIEESLKRLGDRNYRPAPMTALTEGAAKECGDMKGKADDDEDEPSEDEMDEEAQQLAHDLVAACLDEQLGEDVIDRLMEAIEDVEWFEAAHTEAVTECGDVAEGADYLSERIRARFSGGKKVRLQKTPQKLLKKAKAFYRKNKGAILRKQRMLRKKGSYKRSMAKNLARAIKAGTRQENVNTIPTPAAPAAPPAPVAPTIQESLLALRQRAQVKLGTVVSEARQSFALLAQTSLALAEQYAARAGTDDRIKAIAEGLLKVSQEASDFSKNLGHSPIVAGERFGILASTVLRASDALVNLGN